MRQACLGDTAVKGRQVQTVSSSNAAGGAATRRLPPRPPAPAAVRAALLPPALPCKPRIPASYKSLSPPSPRSAPARTVSRWTARLRELHAMSFFSKVTVSAQTPSWSDGCSAEGLKRLLRGAARAALRCAVSAAAATNSSARSLRPQSLLDNPSVIEKAVAMGFSQFDKVGGALGPRGRAAALRGAQRAARGSSRRPGKESCMLARQQLATPPLHTEQDKSGFIDKSELQAVLQVGPVLLLHRLLRCACCAAPAALDALRTAMGSALLSGQLALQHSTPTTPKHAHNCNTRRSC